MNSAREQAIPGVFQFSINQLFTIIAWPPPILFIKLDAEGMALPRQKRQAARASITMFKFHTMYRNVVAERHNPVTSRRLWELIVRQGAF